MDSSFRIPQGGDFPNQIIEALLILDVGTEISRPPETLNLGNVLLKTRARKTYDAIVEPPNVECWLDGSIENKSDRVCFGSHGRFSDRWCGRSEFALSRSGHAATIAI